ncbi:hypothetical protein [Nonomuraea sp. NPDC003709]|uniref:hypothetical protein n=1 Tax=Nonomuraea sp. NPDC003709 TaxID=3154450 RepID=UPI0033B21926
MAVADMTGVDAAKSGRATVMDPSTGQVAAAVPAADETVTAARGTFVLVGAPSSAPGRSSTSTPRRRGRRVRSGTEPALDVDAMLPGAGA